MRKKRIPSFEDVTKYATEFKDLDFTPDYFYDYYNANGWRMNGYKINNWKAVFRVWAAKSRVSLHPKACSKSNVQNPPKHDYESQEEREARLAAQEKVSCSYGDYLRMKAAGEL